MSSKEEDPLESNTTHSPREICELSNKIEDQDNVGSGNSSNGVNKDHSSPMQVGDQDNPNKSMQSLEGDFDGQMQEDANIDHDSYTQAIKDQDRLSEIVQLSEGGSNEQMQDQDHRSEGVQSSEASFDVQTQGVNIDYGSYIQTIENQDHHSEGMQSSKGDSNEQIQVTDHDSYMQVIKDQDYRSEDVPSEVDHDGEKQGVKDQGHFSEGVQNPSNGQTQDVDVDYDSYTEAIKDQDYRSESEESSHNSSDGLTEDIDHVSHTQAVKNQDHHSENVHSLQNGRTQSLQNLSNGRTQEIRKLARTASAGATAENSTEFANKIRHFRSHSTVSELSGKLPLATSQGDNNSGNNSKWPTVTTERIKRSGSPNIKDVFDPNRVDIDTKAPIDSVKSAVSKFGGILDWKAHKVQTVERSKVIDEEIEKVQEEIPLYKEQAEIAEESKVEMLKELENTKRLIEELKLSLEKAETEESQARQDSQVAKLRLEELESGVGDGDSVANKTELEMARNRHKAAITDLKSVKEELESVQKEFAALLVEKDEAVGKEEEAVCASKEMEKTVETLTVELVSMKEALESSNAAHLEAEERRICELVAKDQDLYSWEKELEEAQENLVSLNQQVESANELKLELSIASSRAAELKTELATYMDPKTGEDGGDKTRAGMQAATLGMNNELGEVMEMMDKTSDDVNCLRMASTSLKGELEKEQSELIQLRQREGIASIAVASLEAELDKIKSEIDVVRKREKEARDKMEELPRQLKHASEEAKVAKSEAELAQQGMKMAKEEAEIAKERVNKLESRLLEARKEMEAIRASERLALAAIKAFQESQSTKTKSNDEDSNGKVTITLEEYYELSKKAHEAEEEANTKVAEAVSKIEAANEDVLKSKKQLEDTIREVEEKKEALRIVQEKADKAYDSKVGVEKEVRKRRTEHEQLEKAGQTGQGSSDSLKKSGEESQGHGQPVETLSPRDDKSVFGGSSTIKKKKKSFFPRFLMFFTKKHWKSSSKS